MNIHPRAVQCEAAASGNRRLRTTRGPGVAKAWLTALLLIVGVCVAHAEEQAGLPAVPAGLPPVPYPEDNPPTPEKTALGKQLYFDPRLSVDNTVSCASCHDPAKGFSNGEQFATGVDDQVGGRNSPTIINTAYNMFNFWDGRVGGLEEQALGPIENPIEMNMNLDALVVKLNKISGYREQFEQVFGGPASKETIAKAIATYERTVLSGDAPYDRFRAGDTNALSEAAQRGLKLFDGKAVCSACHTGPNFTDNAFHNIGVGMDQKDPDPGRKEVSGLGGDFGSFKTPTLREIARTAPYMHDGSLKTLEEVVEYYNKGGVKNEFLDEEIFPLDLTKQEQADLVTFLKEGLSSKSYPMHKPPKLPE
jgi:cytochrome c peroxidase